MRGAGTGAEGTLTCVSPVRCGRRQPCSSEWAGSAGGDCGSVGGLCWPERESAAVNYALLPLYYSYTSTFINVKNLNNAVTQGQTYAVLMNEWRKCGYVTYF